LIIDKKTILLFVIGRKMQQKLTIFIYTSESSLELIFLPCDILNDIQTKSGPILPHICYNYSGSFPFNRSPSPANGLVPPLLFDEISGTSWSRASAT